MLILSSCSHHITTQCLTNRVESELQSGKPLVKVGDFYIYEGQVNALFEILPGFKAGWESPDKRKELVGQIIEQELFYQKAKQANLLDNNPRLQKNLWVQIRNYEAGTYLLQEVDKRSHAQYEKDKEKFYTQVEIKDIVYLFNKTGANSTEEQQKLALDKAKATRKIVNAKNFSDIAASETDNQIAKANGGVIGPVSYIDERLKFLGWKPLVDEAFHLNMGKVSEPITTGEGIHIIQVVSKPEVQSYDVVLPYIRAQIEPTVKKEVLDQMLKETKIEYLDPALKP